MAKVVAVRPRPIYRIISRVEKRLDTKLTDGAREMLAIPVLERLEAGQRVSWREVEGSIFEIVAAIRSSPDHDEITKGKFNAIAIVRGFWEKFCNIPPFCKERSQRHERGRKGRKKRSS